MVEIPRFKPSRKLKVQAPNVRIDESIDLGGSVFGRGAAGKKGQARGGANLARAIGGLADTLIEGEDRAAERRQRLTDATFKTETENEVSRTLSAEFDKRVNESDPGAPGFVADFDSFAAGRIEEALSAARAGARGVSEEALVDTRARLEAMATSFNAKTRAAARKAAIGRALDALGVRVNELAASTLAAPDTGKSALANLEATLTAHGGGLSAGTLRKQRVFGRDVILRARVRGLIEADRFADARDVLADPAFAKDLELGTRTTLNAAIATGETAAQAEIAASRREIEQLVARRVGDAEFVLQRGGVPPRLDSLRADAAEFPDLAQRLDDAVAEAETMAEFVHLPPAAQAARLAELAARERRDRREIVRLNAMRTVVAAAAKAIEDDPLGYAVQIDALPALEELDFADPASLARRKAQASAAEAFLGVRPISPLRPGEVEALQTAFEQASGDQVAGLFQSLTAGFGREGAQSVAQQIAPDRPALAVAVSRAPDSPLVASEIVRGARLAAATKGARPTPAEIEPAVAVVYRAAGRRARGLFRDVPSALAPHVEAAVAIYAARKVPTGDLEFDEDLFKQSLVAAAGGPVEFNGQLVLPPVPDMAEETFADLVDSLTSEDLARFGTGAPVFADGTPFVPEILAPAPEAFAETAGVAAAPAPAGSRLAEVQFVTVGPGRYRLFVPGLGYVVTPEGPVYEIDLRKFIEIARGGLP